MILETSVDRFKAQVKFMMKLKFVVQPHFAHGVSAATARAARPLVRMAALHIVPPRAKSARMGIIGIARYSSSLRLALRRTGIVQVPRSAGMRESGHPRGRTAHAVQLRFLG